MARLAVVLLGLVLGAGCRGMFGGGEGDFDRNGSAGLVDANMVERKYRKPAPEVWEAVTRAIRELDLTIQTNKHDALGGEMTARRATGEQIKVTAKSLDAETTQVKVTVGEGDPDLAAIVQQRIGERVAAAR